MEEKNNNKKTIMKECCRECGFPIDLERKPIFITKTDLEFEMYLYNKEKCQTCGHQKSGWTIPCVYEHIQEIMKDKISKQKVKDAIMQHINCSEYHNINGKKATCLDIVLKELKLSDD